MLSPDPNELKTLYKASDIAAIWSASKNARVIDHPQYGLISPNQYRAKYKNKPCPYCGKKMAHGLNIHSTLSRQEAIRRGYEYIDRWGKKTINKAGSRFFHPHYVTLDHKINKARCPELLFDYKNLEAICWHCNQSKGDDNAFELQHTQEYLDSLADEALKRYPLL